MKVKEARKRIEDITKVCAEINAFEDTHEELLGEIEFIPDVIGYLCDYRKALENAIEAIEETDLGI